MRRDAQTIYDELLILRAQDGEVDALNTLVRRWQPALLRHACRLAGGSELGADVLQESWMAIVRGLRRLDDPAHFRAWAYRIVTNKAADAIRDAQRTRRAIDHVTDTHHGTSGGMTQTDDVDSRLHALRLAIRRLDDDHRIVLSMYYLDDMHVREIAHALSLPAGTVKSRLFAARGQIRDEIERNESHERQHQQQR